MFLLYSLLAVSLSAPSQKREERRQGSRPARVLYTHRLIQRENAYKNDCKINIYGHSYDSWRRERERGLQLSLIDVPPPPPRAANKTLFYIRLYGKWMNRLSVELLLDVCPAVVCTESGEKSIGCSLAIIHTYIVVWHLVGIYSAELRIDELAAAAAVVCKHAKSLFRCNARELTGCTRYRAESELRCLLERLV